MKKCVLEEKECVDCGQCDDRCELNPGKVCDNCFRCLDMETRPYAEIPISGVYLEDEYLPEAGELYAEQRRLYHIQTLRGMYGELVRRR